jgi:hypothetical protein
MRKPPQRAGGGLVSQWAGLARPFFAGAGSARAAALYAGGCCALALASTLLSVRISYAQRRFSTGLAEKKPGAAGRGRSRNVQHGHAATRQARGAPAQSGGQATAPLPQAPSPRTRRPTPSPHPPPTLPKTPSQPHPHPQRPSGARSASSSASSLWRRRSRRSTPSCLRCSSSGVGWGGGWGRGWGVGGCHRSGGGEGLLRPRAAAPRCSPTSVRTPPHPPTHHRGTAGGAST